METSETTTSPPPPPLIAVSAAVDAADAADPSDAELMSGQSKDQADQHPAFNISSASAPPSPSAVVLSPTRPQGDDDAIHLAPEGSKSPSSGGPAGLLVASERRMSFCQQEGRARSRSVGEKQWTRVRAVMAWYTRLRRIKKSRSAQRWMKLRTTVQLTSAISSSVAQSKKTSLKREDSFIARFSTRQFPEAQETFDATDEGGSSSGGNGGSGTCGGGLPALGDNSKVAGGGTGSSNSASEKVKRRRRHQKPPRSVLNPDENGLFYWLAFLALWVLYNLWTVVVRLAFPELQQGENLFAWNVCDALGDAAYALDIAVQFRTGYLEQGIMVHDSRMLAAHYIRSKAFLIDIFSLLPIDWMLLTDQVANPVMARWRPAARFLRLTKLYRVFAFYYVVESRIVYPNAWRVVNLVHILLMLAHWFGCFYYLLSEWEGFQSDWSYPYPEGDFATLTRKYLGSLYWSTLTLTTIGDLPTPETNAEYIFTIASYLIGVFIFATIVGQVGNVITNRNASRLEFERLLDTAKLYMRHHKVPRSMQRRVQRWYDYSWSRGRIQGGGDTSSALRILPDKLKTELALHVNLATLKKVSIFKECQPEFLHDLVLKMRASIFTPGDMICRRGEVAREMFIIADGILEVISETGKVLTSMQAGDFFGEIGILNLDGLNKRTADVRSVGYAELFSLSREDVLTAMKDYPEAEEILLSLGRKRLMEARKMASQHRAQMARKGLLALEKAAQLRAQQQEAATAGTGAGAEGSTQSAASKFTDRIRSDVFGLKKAISKSFKESRRPKSDSPTIEMGTYGGVGSTLGGIGGGLSKASSVPLGNSTLLSLSPSGSKSHLLRRMPRVASDEAQTTHHSSSEDCRLTQPLLQKPESPVEVIGAGLPLFQRLKLLRQRELEKEKQQQQEQEALLSKAEDAETIRSLQLVSVALLETTTAADGVGVGKSTPPPVSPPPSTMRDDKQARHISFVDETNAEKNKRDYVPVDPPKVRGKSARWTLPGMVGRASEQQQPAKLNKTRLSRLNTIKQASSSSSAIDSLEQAEPPPPLPPPLPPTPPFWQSSKPSPSPPPRPLAPPRPPAPHFPGLGIRRKKPPRRAQTLRADDSPCSVAEADDVPYRPVQHFRSMIKQPWHWSGDLNQQQRQQSSTPPPPSSSSSSKSRPLGPSGVPLSGRRFSRQNTIQVVSDVQGVLSDILRDIVPSSKSSSRSTASTKPLMSANPAVQSPASVDYGAMRQPTTNWESVRHETIVGDRPPQRPQRLNLRQCKNRSSRDYNSIDDLSPEYTVLPFVKRLKILNERQKIVELQKALTTTATTSVSIVSESSGERTTTVSTTKNSSAGGQIPAVESLVKGVGTSVAAAESNETPERVCLKKMLKSASRKEMLLPQDQNHRMKLLRSQTVEGYAVRHSNFTKLNHQRLKNNHRIAQTMPSPPPLPFHQPAVTDSTVRPPTPLPLDHQDLLPGFKSMGGVEQKQLSYFKASGHDGVKEECVAELLTAIKTVLQERLDEIQARFQAQIHLLRSEVEKKDQLISQLEIQLESFGVQLPVSIIPVIHQQADSSETHSEREDEPTSSIESDDDEGDDDSRTLRYFARSVSKGSFIHLAPPSPSTPQQSSSSPGSDSHQQPSPCPSIDDMLDSAAEEHQPTAAVLNPEPLWQLEFGSCWHRMQSSPVTSNPRDFIVDIEESSLSSVSSSSSATETIAPSKRKKMRAMSLDIVGSRRQAASAASAAACAPSNGASKSTPARSPAAPYNPDWEILMLAESMDKEDEDDFHCQPLPVRLRQDELPAGSAAGASAAAVRRRRSLRSSTSVDPQSMSSAKSKKMIEKWYWSYPPPMDEATDFPAKSDAGGNK
ncbi:uncharacterized protein LOC124195647 isoform X6 [Daphnia pulex]|uniref:uncharacterized protein LOC124195647 isoform X6 n=1 Tax=Daphnia pulex TaxID=6669 RepID=UPI001EE14AD1|nr:uncharacterized protein LOC124195647 isoform X6 [Daphnia pulex]